MRNKYEIEGNTVRVHVNSKTYGDFIVFIDTEDLHMFEDITIGIRMHRDRPSPILKKKGKSYSLHRYILGYNGDLIVDHIDRNPLNNKKENLRLGTVPLNGQNRRLNKNSTTGVPGLHWDKRKQKWLSHLSLNGERVLFKHFADKDEAIRAIEEAREKFHEWTPK